MTKQHSARRAPGGLARGYRGVCLTLLGVGLAGLPAIGDDVPDYLKVVIADRQPAGERGVAEQNVLALDTSMMDIYEGSLAQFKRNMRERVPIILALFSEAGGRMILYRNRAPRTLFLSIFLVYLAMFVLAPRIHERYLYPALAIMIPLVFESPALTSIFVTLSATFLFNLAYVKRFNEHEILLAPHDRLAAAAALINLAALVVAAAYGLIAASGTDEPDAKWPAPLRAFFRPRDSRKNAMQPSGVRRP